MPKNKQNDDEYFTTDLGERVRRDLHRHPENGIGNCDTCGWYGGDEDREIAWHYRRMG